jgi:E3 ubiquitin-protein ligase HERC1
VTLADLEGLDAFSAQMVKDIRAHGAKLGPDAFDAAVDETFSTYLANGQAHELCAGGKDMAVTHANHKEYLDLVTKVRLGEVERQVAWIREGVEHVIPLPVLAFLTWEEVELRACGPKDINIDALKAISEYNVGADHKHIKWFWQMFENFTQMERRKYLKFVWGRSKLPVDTSDL